MMCFMCTYIDNKQVCHVTFQVCLCIHVYKFMDTYVGVHVCRYACM